jgi:DNA-binding NarL/FixJ family response regulator
VRHPLSPRQREIWEALHGTDTTYAEIASRLGISVRTVGKIAEIAYRKLGVVNRWGDKPRQIRTRIRSPQPADDGQHERAPAHADRA